MRVINEVEMILVSGADLETALPVAPPPPPPPADLRGVNFVFDN